MGQGFLGRLNQRVDDGGTDTATDIEAFTILNEAVFLEQYAEMLGSGQHIRRADVIQQKSEFITAEARQQITVAHVAL